MMKDLRESNWKKADIITFSGSGEPTLALNLGEAIRESAKFTEKPVLVLSNGTLWGSEKVREELCQADQVFLKLDAATEEVFRKVNRPVDGVTLGGIIDAAIKFRREYSGRLGVQMMFVYSNLKDVDLFAELLNRIQPDEIQVNTPTRPYPTGWYLASRGSHEGVDYPATPLKQIPPRQLSDIENKLRDKTGLKITSLHQRG
jgi:wyosine [tRNA(Phe)-imidazoG37] synthetase (radical SAM superfamily)